MTTVVIGTAGHIDHGKTTLLRALTGIDADRLPEERRRGMTIDVGYAHLDLPDGGSIDFVDVPGHDRLVGNMLVGAGEIDAALLVVAADDGPRAQTLEHLELLDGLGVSDGLAVVTKADAVGTERVAEVAAEVDRLLGPTSLSGSLVLAVSATAGTGLGELRAAILRLRDRIAGRVGAHDGAAEMAVDRAFVVRGRGTVVTGTLRGTIERGDEVRIEPDGLTVTVREIQVHGVPVERSTGGRTALNLRGVEAGQLRRGQRVVGPGPTVVQRSDRLLIALQPALSWRSEAASTPWTAPRGTERLRLHLGTEAADARVARTARVASNAGSGTVCVVQLDRMIAVAPGERFVLRRPAPSGTAAAGRVLDPSPPRGPARRRATPERLAALLAAVDREAWLAASLELHGARVARDAVQLAPDVREALRATAAQLVAAHHADTLVSAGLALADLRLELGRATRRLVALDPASASAVAGQVVDDLVGAGRLARSGDRVRDPSQADATPDALAAAMDRLEAALALPAPPPLLETARAVGCPPEGVAALATSGRIVRLEDDLAWAASTYRDLAARALAMAAREPLSPAAFRDATGTSRRFVVAILEDLDRRAILRRTPAGHVPGPRAPT
jgi:selenocysteine-specific elongation factor